MKNSIERQREHFDQISGRYTEARKHPNHLLLKDLIWKAFFEDLKIEVPDRMKVLEPMCGMGEGLQIMQNYFRRDISYSGFDYSEEMVKFAQQRNPDAHIEVGDATSYDHGESKYDWIILIGGLHHVFAQAPNVVQRLAMALAPGGYFLNFEPTQNCWLTRRARNRIYESNALFDEQTEQGFELGALDEMFEQAGFEKVKQAYPGLLSYVLYYNPDAFPALNIGGGAAVRAAFGLDRLFWRTWVGGKLSFATITLWQLK